MNYFQTILLVIFGFTMIIGLLVFGGILPGYRATQGGSGGTIVLWGTIPKDTQMESLLGDLNKQASANFNLDYIYKDPATFNSDLVEALATGQGPDIFFLPHESLGANANKAALIPYSSLPARTFADTFVSGASIFETSQGIIAVPLLVDPMVMYFNQDLLTNANLAQVPANWPAMLIAVKALTKIDAQGNISQSALPFGEFANNKNAKEVLGTLILQSGNPIISLGSDNKPIVNLGDNSGNGLAPSRSAVDFFTQFANPAKTTYDWNRSLPEASTAFINGTLAFYFGFGSELNSLATRNPHLFFDLATVPQRNDQGARRLTFGRFTGLAISVQSKKPSYALQAIQVLTGPTFAGRLATLAGVAPARRDLLAAGSADPKQAVIFQSGLIASAWLDPNPAATKKIFGDMISSIMTGLADSGVAINTAASEIANLFIPNNG